MFAKVRGAKGRDFTFGCFVCTWPESVANQLLTLTWWVYFGLVVVLCPQRPPAVVRDILGMWQGPWRAVHPPFGGGRVVDLASLYSQVLNDLCFVCTGSGGRIAWLIWTGAKREYSRRARSPPRRRAPGRRGHKLVIRGRTLFPPWSDAGSLHRHCDVKMRSPPSLVMTSYSAKCAASSTSSLQRSSRSWVMTSSDSSYTLASS